MTTNNVAYIQGVRAKGLSLKGEYQVVREDSDVVVIKHPTLGNLRVPRANAKLPDAQGVTLAYAELVKEIASRFAVLDRMMDGIIAGRVRSLIVSGSPGVGKTHTIETRMEKAQQDGKINKYIVVRGTISPIGLFMLIWKYRHAGDVIVLDDSDSIFFDETGASLIKAATDSAKRRRVSYLKEAAVLEQNGVPQNFDYEGALIVATNINFEREVQMQTKIAKHLEAILNRALYLDLAMSSRMALMARVEDVCRSTPMLKDLGLNDAQINELVQWLKDNQANVRSLSLRTACQMASLILTDPVGWQDIAKVTLLQATRG